MNCLLYTKNYFGCAMLLAIFMIGCGQTDPESVPDEYEGTGQIDTSMLDEDHARAPMRHDPEMMRSMMQDTTAMRRMMADPSIVSIMAQRMTEHPELMRGHMKRMMNDSAHRRAMTDILRENPSMRAEMQTILADSEPTSSLR